MSDCIPQDSQSDEALRRDLAALIPAARAFARTLSRFDATAADDLAQEGLAKAWKNRSQFQPGTNTKAWLFMIIRNQFYSDKRRSWRMVELDQEVAERTLVATNDVEASLELEELRQALGELTVDQREAIILIGAGGMSYEDAALICGVPTGTMKSRVSRARVALAAILDADNFRCAPAHSGLALGRIMSEFEGLKARRTSSHEAVFRHLDVQLRAPLSR